jgi:hypothetical protein
VSTQKNVAGDGLAQHLNRAPQALAVGLGAAGKRWPLRTFLTKGQVTPQNHEAGDISNSVGKRDQQLRLAISAGPVSQHQPMAGWLSRFVDEAANRRLRGNISDFANRNFRQHGNYCNAASEIVAALEPDSFSASKTRLGKDLENIGQA